MAGGETGRREMWKGREGGKTDERERGNHTSGTGGPMCGWILGVE